MPAGLLSCLGTSRSLSARSKVRGWRGGGSGGASVAAASETIAASVVDGLAPAKVAWNTPPKIALGETAEVELRVTLDEKLFPGIADRVRAGGATTAETIELSRDLTAKLESTAFDVKPDGERRQAVRKARDAVWSWVCGRRSERAEFWPVSKC